jgi:molybdate-binding protein
VHDQSPPAPLAARHEFLLVVGGVHEQDVGLAAGTELDRLAAADRDALHLTAALALEGGNEHVEEARVLRARGGREDHGAIARLRPVPSSLVVTAGGRRRQRDQQSEKDENSPSQCLYQYRSDAMLRRVTRYVGLVEELEQAVASGALAPGAALPSVRALARERGVAPATVARAYAELARAGVIETSPRRATRVAAAGTVRARRRLRGGRPLLLAGSDDPLLDLLVVAASDEVERLGARGSSAGLAALWRGSVDAATLHLADRGGEYNAPYAARMLSGRSPRLVRLWRREQGLVVPLGNPQGLGSAADLARVMVALRRPGSGTRLLTERLAREGGADPADIQGPELDSHLDVALAVASGLADAGVAVRSAAAALGLDFVPLAWEPFDLALPAEALPRAEALLAALATPDVARRAGELGGYDLEGGGVVAAAA